MEVNYQGKTYNLSRNKYKNSDADVSQGNLHLNRIIYG